MNINKRYRDRIKEYNSMIEIGNVMEEDRKDIAIQSLTNGLVPARKEIMVYLNDNNCLNPNHIGHNGPSATCEDCLDSKD